MMKSTNWPGHSFIVHSAASALVMAVIACVLQTQPILCWKVAVETCTGFSMCLPVSDDFPTDCCCVASSGGSTVLAACIWKTWCRRIKTVQITSISWPLPCKPSQPWCTQCCPLVIQSLRMHFSGRFELGQSTLRVNWLTCLVTDILAMLYCFYLHLHIFIQLTVDFLLIYAFMFCCFLWLWAHDLCLLLPNLLSL